MELESAGQDPQVIEILHPAVGDAEHDHGLELLGHDRLPRVGLQHGGREIEQHRVGDLDRRRRHHVAEADVDLDRNPGVLQTAGQVDMLRGFSLVT